MFLSFICIMFRFYFCRINSICSWVVHYGSKSFVVWRCKFGTLFMNTFSFYSLRIPRDTYASTSSYYSYYTSMQYSYTRQIFKKKAVCPSSIGRHCNLRSFPCIAAASTPQKLPNQVHSTFLMFTAYQSVDDHINHMQ